MRATESRRITGRHLLLDGPGAALDLSFEPGDDPDAILAGLEARVREGATYLNLDVGPLRLMRIPQGARVGIRAPSDALYGAAELLDWAIADDPVGPALRPARRELREEHNPALLACLSAAGSRPAFLDEDGFSLGLGKHCLTWPLDALPDPTDLPATCLGIPTLYITGTNGKTTTTRLLACIVSCAGEIAGFTSSDGVVVDGQVLERGDWTGPGAARAVLRHPEVSVALLETARGGLMRRGLVYDRVDAAIVTNVSADHLGEWGLHTVEEMARAKIVVGSGVKRGGTLIVHGKNPPLEEATRQLNNRRRDLRIERFADTPDPTGLDAWADETHLWWREGGIPVRLMALSEIPISLEGTARHNVENAMSAALGARALRLPTPAIREGLRSFQPSVEESAGRSNRFRLPSGAIVLVDFAHNPAGLHRVAEMVRRWDKPRRHLVLGQAGDRSDEDHFALGVAGAAVDPAQVYLKDLPDHRRGRAPGEGPSLIREAMVGAGVSTSAITTYPDEPTASRAAIDGAGPDVALVLLVHESLPDVLAQLYDAGATPW